MIGASLSLSRPGMGSPMSFLAHVPGVDVFARYDDKYGVGGIFYSQGAFGSAAGVTEHIPSGQPTSVGLLVEDEATNLLAFSTCDQHIGGRGTTPPSVAPQTDFDGVSCTRATFTPGSDRGFTGSRIAQDAGTDDASYSAAETTYSLYVGLSRELTGSEALSYYWTGSDASAQTEINAANSAQFVGTLVRLSVTKTHAGAGAIYPVVYLKQTLTSDVDVYVAKGQAELGAMASSWIETAASPVTRPAAAPTLVQGPGPTLFPGASNVDELTFALEWKGVPNGTGAERALLNVQALADYGVSDNNRATLFYEIDGSLVLGVANTIWQGGINAGASFDDGELHRAIVYLNRVTGELALSVDRGAFLTVNKVGVMPTSFDVAGIGHTKSGATASDQSRGNHLEVAAAGGDHREAWR